jgi:hypothetical protein
VAWVEHKRRTGHVITDYLAAQIAGQFLKQAIESGYDDGREIYTMTVDEVLHHASAVVKEAGGTAKLPSLPVIRTDDSAQAVPRRMGSKPEEFVQILGKPAA